MPFREVLQQLLTVMAILGTVTFIVQLGGAANAAILEGLVARRRWQHVHGDFHIYIYNYIYMLVGGLEHFLFSISYLG